MPSPHVVAETSIPNFLLKLWKLVEDEQYNNCIQWDETGFSFHVTEPYQFSKEVLPMYFKHSNLNSFVRQLNMYGFRKVTSLEKGAMKPPAEQPDTLEFQHPYFVRNHPELLQYIKRKVSNPRVSAVASNYPATAVFSPMSPVEINSDITQQAIGAPPTVGGPSSDSGLGPTDHPSTSEPAGQQKSGIGKILDEVRYLRDKQYGMDAKLNQVKMENQALWREVVNMRQTHMKQQEVVNKLIRFLVSLVQSGSSSTSSGGNQRVGKRHFLAIEPSLFNTLLEPTPPKRLRRNFATSSTDAVNIVDSIEQEMLSRNPTPKSTASLNVNTGPIISDVTHEMEDEVDDVASQFLSAASPREQQRPPSGSNVALSPGGTGPVVGENVQLSLNSAGYDPSQEIPVALESFINKSTDRAPSTDSFYLSSSGEGTSKLAPDGWNLQPTNNNQLDTQFSDHLDFVQSDLDSLKDFLNSEAFNLDQEALNNLFLMAEESNAQNQSATAEIVGNEVQLYKPPSLLIPLEEINGATAGATAAPSPTARQTPFGTPPSFTVPQYSPRAAHSPRNQFAEAQLPSFSKTSGSALDLNNLILHAPSLSGSESNNFIASDLSTSSLTTPINSPPMNSNANLIAAFMNASNASGNKRQVVNQSNTSRDGRKK